MKCDDCKHLIVDDDFFTGDMYCEKGHWSCKIMSFEEPEIDPYAFCEDYEECGGWVAAKTRCPLCSYECFSMFHIDCKKLECTNCGNMVEHEMEFLDLEDE